MDRLKAETGATPMPDPLAQLPASDADADEDTELPSGETQPAADIASDPEDELVSEDR